MEWLVRVHFLQDHIRVTYNYPQHVVGIVGHTTGQAAHGFHFLCLAQLAFEFFFLRFGLLTFGDVTGRSQNSFSRAVVRLTGLRGSTAAIL